MPTVNTLPRDVLRVHTDGASRGNPGRAAVGVVVYGSDGMLRAEVGRDIGIMTNNRAEYLAVHAGFELLAEMGGRSAHFCLDSELVVKQLQGLYKVRDSDLAVLHSQARALATRLRSVTYEHVPRARNKRADELANLALDGKAIHRIIDAVPPADELPAAEPRQRELF